jgi:hypothetical protein
VGCERLGDLSARTEKRSRDALMLARIARMEPARLYPV